VVSAWYDFLPCPCVLIYWSVNRLRSVAQAMWDYSNNMS
jgi:hypothetical protein